MNKTGSRTAQLLAALILLPLLVVAAMVGIDLFAERSLMSEADELTAALDRALARPVAGTRKGLAVLPLSNDSAGSAMDYLADGVSADIRDRLTHVPDLIVIGAESSRNVARHSLPIAGAARLLGVSHVLHGAIRGSGAELILELELSRFDGEPSPMWRREWTGTAEVLLSKTTSVAAQVAGALSVSASVAQSAAGAAAGSAASGREAPPASALDDYLHGKYLIDRYNRSEVLAGIDFLARAISTDPGFERAVMAKIAGHQRMTWIDAQVATDHVALTEATIDAYLALDADTALTHRLRSLRASNANRPLEAFEAFRRAVEISPQAYAYDRGYMMDLCKAGYLDRCLEQARGLARADPVSAAAHTALATVYFLKGDHERMLEHARLSARFGGDLAGYYEAHAFLALGDYEATSETMAAALEDVGVSGDWVAAFVAAVTDRAAAPAAVAAMRAVDDASAEWLDQFYTELVVIGELDLAFEATQTMIDERYETWNLYAWEPNVRPYRDDPRFVEAMQAMGLVDLWNLLGPPDACRTPAPEDFCYRAGIIVAESR